MITQAIGAAPTGVASLQNGVPGPAVSTPAVPGATPQTGGTPAATGSMADLHQAVSTINAMVQKISTSLSFSVDHSTGMTVVKVVEADSGQVIRQIPSEEILSIARALDRLQGLIIRNKA